MERRRKRTTTHRPPIWRSPRRTASLFFTLHTTQMRAKYDRGRRGTPRRPARRAASTYGTRSSDRFLPRESRKLEQASVHLKLFAYLRILTLSTLRDHTLSNTPFFTPKRGIFYQFWRQRKKDATKHTLPKFQQDFPTKNGVPHLPHHPHPAVLNVHAALWCLVQPPSVQVIDAPPPLGETGAGHTPSEFSPGIGHMSYVRACFKNHFNLIRASIVYSVTGANDIFHKKILLAFKCDQPVVFHFNLCLCTNCTECHNDGE